MTLPRVLRGGHALLWGWGVRVAAGVVTLIGMVLIGYAAAQSSRTAQLDEQIDLATTALAGLGLVVIALTAWVLAGRHRLMRRRSGLTRRGRAALDPHSRHAPAVTIGEPARVAAGRSSAVAVIQKCRDQKRGGRR
jgi:hypothetical protein